MAGGGGLMWVAGTGAAAVMVMCWAATATAMAMGSIDCNTVTTLISSCSNFIMNGSPDPVLGAPCCNGLVSLYNIVDSTDSRRSACSCLMALIATYNPQATRIARVPGLCGISLGFTIDPNTNCNSIL